MLGRLLAAETLAEGYQATSASLGTYLYLIERMNGPDKGAAVHILPRISAAISILAIICTAQESYAEQKAREGRVVGRIVMVYQIYLTISSFAFLLGSLPSPDGLPWTGYARGTVATCEAQGFAFQFGTVGALLCDAFLTTCFLFMVLSTRTWTEKRLRKYERMVYTIILIVALGGAIVPLPLQMYNNGGTDLCWITTVPFYCDGDCYRGGAGLDVLQYPTMILVVIVLLYSIGAMIVIFFGVRRRETVMARRYSFGALETQRICRERSHATAIQGILHASTYAIATTPFLVQNMFLSRSYWFYVFSETMLPTGGLLTMLVYIRPRTMKTPYGQFVKRLLKKITRGRCWCKPAAKKCGRAPTPTTKAIPTPASASNTQETTQSDRGFMAPPGVLESVLSGIGSSDLQDEALPPVMNDWESSELAFEEP